MSTRCNILIKSGSTNIWLYRHCDGYLSETGYNLASTLSHCNGFKNFLDNLLNDWNCAIAPNDPMDAKGAAYTVFATHAIR